MKRFVALVDLEGERLTRVPLVSILNGAAFILSSFEGEETDSGINKEAGKNENKKERKNE